MSGLRLANTFMDFSATPVTVSTALLVAFALFVAYTRTRNWLDSNIPLFFYISMVIYANTSASDGRLTPWVIYAGLALGLLLRFEFMSSKITVLIKTCEFFTLGAIVYECMGVVLQ